MIKRRKTRTVTVGKVKIGSGYPVSIQSMAKTDTKDVGSTIKQIRVLEERGCEIIRVAVKDKASAEAISDIKKEISIPLVADIHFDHVLALEAIKYGADKIRINPGNIKKPADIKKVIESSAERKVAIRLGINSGSLMEDAGGRACSSKAMAEYLLRYLEHFGKMDFRDLVISVKSSDVLTTIASYRFLSSRVDYPFHVGVTAAGLSRDGIVRSGIGIGTLLLEGIGDTIRVSLTGSPEEEVDVAKSILSALNLRNFGYELIACPTCGRCQVDLVPIVKEIEENLARLVGHGPRSEGKPLLVAVMGCEVNGPGEARGADIGVAFGKGKGAIFQNGKIIKTVSDRDAVSVLVALVEKMQAITIKDRRET